MSALILNEMIWPEVEAKREDIKICIVPIGSCEQHGQSMTFATDTARAEAVCRLLGERMGDRALICPTVPYGISHHHMPFPGTITVRAESFIAILSDIAVALKKHGFQKIAFLNAHGGNNSALDVLVNKLKYDYDIDALYAPVGGKIGADAVQPDWGWTATRGHGCEGEGSQALAICPEIIRDERIPGKMRPKFAAEGFNGAYVYGGTYAWNWKNDFTENGSIGDVSQSNAENGWSYTEMILTHLLRIIEEFIEREVADDCKSSLDTSVTKL